MSRKPRYKSRAYAVVRLDHPDTTGVPLADRFTVKEVVWTEEEAEREVERLRSLNGGKRCEYFWQVARLMGEPPATV